MNATIRESLAPWIPKPIKQIEEEADARDILVALDYVEKTASPQEVITYTAGIMEWYERKQERNRLEREL